MYMKEVVWVYGPSAAGKETFIKKIIGQPSASLLEQFGWIDKKIMASQTSLDHIGQFSNDPVVENREEIIKDVAELLQSSDVVLIKGQYVDFENDRPQRLKNLVPTATHKLVLFQTSLGELGKRLLNKKWWNDAYDLDKFSAHEKQFINDQIKNLSGFEVIKVDSSQLGKYKILARR